MRVVSDSVVRAMELMDEIIGRASRRYHPRLHIRAPEYMGYKGLM